MESYHIRIKATYDNVITAGSFAEASEQAENEIAPGWISEEIHVTKEGEKNEHERKHGVFKHKQL